MTAVLLALAITIGAPQGIDDAKRVALDLIFNHPDSETKQGLGELLKKNQLALSAALPVRELEAQIVFASNGTPVPTLAIQPSFLLGRKFSDPADDLLYKQFLLFIAYQEFKGHFSGRWPMELFVERSPQRLPPERYRDEVWKRSYEIKKAQWDFIKRRHGERLLPVTSKLTRAYGDELGLLKSFCFSLASGAAPYQREFVPYWLELCKTKEKELQR
jgi:hypothetical protein